ncbi:MAG: FAD-binding protein [Oscillospiraceae bacterium]|nr:FAD-binding protein [Oscillospiraceae bacterium]
MIKVSGIKVPAAEGKKFIKRHAARVLGVKPEDITALEVLKESVDSRKKPDVYFIYTAAVGLREGVTPRGRFETYVPDKYTPVTGAFPPENRPVVVGMGPAGLFAALTLAEGGVPCTVIERGQPVEQRDRDVNRFWSSGKLDTESNVQFGEGGAGTFSDGKLTTGTNDPRIGYVFRRFAEFGAPEEILYLAKPHIGTDRLKTVVKNIREHLISLGCDIRFGSKFTGFSTDENGLNSVQIQDKDGVYELKTRHLILAPGNGARDTFRMLHDHGVRMEPKSFAVGVRIEHLQRDIDMTQYGEAATLGTLPASSYKLAVHLTSGRGVFTFCVCPGGSVVAASSETGGVVTNGMSDFARDGKNINGGLLVSVTPADFDGLFGGMEFQAELERSAFRHGGGAYGAPAQLVKDFLGRRPSTDHGRVAPTYRPAVRFCNLWDVLPGFICEAIAEALPLMNRKIRGFADGDAVLTAAETRSSSPVRILRDENYGASVPGIYPCGEGAGYAGGITTSSVDGIKCAEKILESLK